MITARINRKKSKKIYKDTGILIEPKTYEINQDIKIESPSTVNGVDFSQPFRLGAFTHINPSGYIKNCTIGRYCSIAMNVKIGNGNHPTNWLSVNACQYINNFRNYNNILKNKIYTKSFTPYKHTVIGNDVWIGANVYIKDGIKIGDGAIIGANSVVTHDVEPYAIVAGAPAKLIRYRFTSEIISQLQELKWWAYDISEFEQIDFDNIEKAIEQLKIKLPTLKKYKPQAIDGKYLSQFAKPIKRKIFGLLTTKEDFEYKTKYFAGIKICQKRKNKGAI